jgi:coatomer subunit beta
MVSITSSSDIDVRKKAINIALDIVSSRNVKEVVGFFKKELLKTLEKDHDNVFTRLTFRITITDSY